MIMDNIVLLSIIIPAYNCASTIERTIDSIIAQKCDDYEIIIINDGSKDNTLEVCEVLGNKNASIKIINKDNTGVADTRNVGLKNAVGKYIAFLDSDDVWDKDYYDEELKVKLKNGTADIFVFSCCFADLDCIPTEYINIKTEKLCGGDYATGLFYHSFCSFIFKRVFLLENCIEFPNDLQYGEDEVFRSKALYLADAIESEDRISFYYIDNPYSSTKMNRSYKMYALQKLLAYFVLKDFFFEQYKNRKEEIRIKNNITSRYLTEALRLLPEVGYGYKKYKKLCLQENINGLINNSGKGYCLDEVTIDRLRAYLSNPAKYYFKQRV